MVRYASMELVRQFSLRGLVTAAYLLAAPPAFASVDREHSFAAVRVQQPPALDAQLTDPAWLKGVVALDFINLTTRRPAEHTTTAYLLYDDQNLYVGFKVEQRGVRMTANQTTNNVGYGLDDWVAIGIDTSGNGAQKYFFFVTPRGVRYQQSTESARYDPPWSATAQMSGGEWTADLVVPLKDLRAAGGAVQAWRFNFARQIVATNDVYTWAYDTRMGDAGDSTWWPALTDLRLPHTAARPRSHAELYGLFSGGRDRNVFPQPSGAVEELTARNYGVDFAYPFTGSLALVGTFAPDFSNVETDQLTITPQEFQRRLTEYRPFFAQGADYLTPGLHDGMNGQAWSVPFYSPSIGSFNRGLKIEGTLGLNALGILEAKGNGFDDIAFGLNHKTADQAFRFLLGGVVANHLCAPGDMPSVSHDCGRDETLQFGFRKTDLKTGFEFGGQHTFEQGDFVPQASQADFDIAYASVQRPYYYATAGYRDVGPYYSPIDGFTLLNDIRGPFATAGVNGNGSGPSRLKTWDAGFYAERYLDRVGNPRESQTIEYSDVTFKSLFGISLADVNSSLRVYPSGNGYPLYLGASTMPFHQSEIDLNYKRGTDSPLDVNYSWGPFASQCPGSPPAPTFCGPSSTAWVPFDLQQFGASMSHPLGRRFSVTLELDGTRERAASAADSQWLRRISLGESLGPDSNVSIALRSISGTGGFATPGVDLAVSFHRKFSGGNELFVAYGTPAATATLNRLIIKYVLHFGGGTGT